MNEDKLNEAIKYNLDYLEGNYSIEEDLEETYKCLKETQQELDRYKKQIQNISNEFLKYDWENSTKEQIVNQLKSLYNSIFKNGGDKE